MYVKNSSKNSTKFIIGIYYKAKFIKFIIHYKTLFDSSYSTE